MARWHKRRMRGLISIVKKPEIENLRKCDSLHITQEKLLKTEGLVNMCLSGHAPLGVGRSAFFAS
jgi:hypothetical protein